MEAAINTYDAESIKEFCINLLKQMTDINLLRRTADFMSSIKSDNYVDPYLTSPSGDPFWSYKCNVDELNSSLKAINEPEDKKIVLESDDDIDNYLGLR